MLDANDAEFANFKVMLTNADGSMQAKALSELGIVQDWKKTGGFEELWERNCA